MEPVNSFLHKNLQGILVIGAKGGKGGSRKQEIQEF